MRRAWIASPAPPAVTTRSVTSRPIKSASLIGEAAVAAASNVRSSDVPPALEVPPGVTPAVSDFVAGAP